MPAFPPTAALTVRSLLSSGSVFPIALLTRAMGGRNLHAQPQWTGFILYGITGLAFKSPIVGYFG